jgi:large subunit ribosomal protein L21
MYAIIEESGGQRHVTKDEQVLIDLYKEGLGKVGDTITFDKVLVVGKVGGSAKLGTPTVAGASVTAEIVEPVAMGDKVHIFKYEPKKTWRKKIGHRQRYTSVKITSIIG